MPTEVSDWNDLDAMRNDLAGEYILTADLDENTTGYGDHASETANGGDGWESIGDDTTPFTGTFDGDGHSISDMYSDRDEWVGLFGEIDTGTIENLSVLDFEMHCTLGFGPSGIGVWIEESTVHNCHVTGHMTDGDDNAGGISAIVFPGTTITRCSADVTIDGLNTASRSCPFVGWLEGATVEDSWARGSMAEMDNDSAIFCGVMRSGAVIRDCYAIGPTVHAPSGSRVGGFVARMRDDAHVERCFSVVESITGESQVGGFVGSLEDNATVADSFWDEEVSNLDTSPAGTAKTTAEMQDIDTYTDTGTEGLDSPWDMVTMSNFTGNETWVIEE